MIPPKRAFVALALALVVVVAGVGAMAPVAVADDAPPDLPASYYGEITIDGEPAPPGTEIVAEIGGEERGSIVVEDTGEFGSPTITDEKLAVAGDGDDAGETVTFRVFGQALEATPEVTWESGDVAGIELAGDDLDRPHFAVEIDESVSTTTVEPNETATVVADVENVGDAPGETEVAFELDNETLETAELVLEDGDAETVDFDVHLEDEGEYEAIVQTADDAAATTLVVDEDAAEPPPGPPVPPEPPVDPGPPDISVTGAELGETEIETGESVAVDATLANDGEESGEHTAELTVDGQAVTEETVAVDAGTSVEVTLSATFDDAGEYELAVNGVSAGTLSVVDPGAPDVSVVDAELGETEIETGESVAVDATLSNIGTAAGEHTAELTVDGQVVAEETVAVDAGANVEVTLSATFDDAGEYELAVDDVSAGTVTVEAESADDGVPGFGVAIALVALLVGAALAARRLH